MAFWKGQNNKDRKEISFCRRLAVRKEIDHKRGIGEISRVMEVFYILIVVVFTCLYVLIKIYRAVHLKRVNFMCELYLSKPD